MSLREIFRKKSGAVLLSATIALGGIGGIAGYELTQEARTPDVSGLTLNQHSEETFMGKADEGARLQQVGEDKNRAGALAGFHGRIDNMAMDNGELLSITDELSGIKISSSNADADLSRAYYEKLQRKEALEKSLAEQGKTFVNELLLSANITEKDYVALAAEFDAYAGAAVPKGGVNYREGAAYRQECQIATAFPSLFMGDDTDEERADDTGSCMQDASSRKDSLADLGGALGGALLGAGLTGAFWLQRSKKNSPKI